MLEELKKFEIKKEELICIQGGDTGGGTGGGQQGEDDPRLEPKKKPCDWWDIVCQNTP